jgi:hypothetical protein
MGRNEEDVVERQGLADHTHQTLLCAKTDYTLLQSLAAEALNSIAAAVDSDAIAACAAPMRREMDAPAPPTNRRAPRT